MKMKWRTRIPNARVIGIENDGEYLTVQWQRAPAFRQDALGECTLQGNLTAHSRVGLHG
jgi:hypothetical protein